MMYARGERGGRRTMLKGKVCREMKFHRKTSFTATHFFPRNSSKIFSSNCLSCACLGAWAFIHFHFIAGDRLLSTEDLVVPLGVGRHLLAVCSAHSGGGLRPRTLRIHLRDFLPHPLLLIVVGFAVVRHKRCGDSPCCNRTR
jgi:hypothetical protein